MAKALPILYSFRRCPYAIRARMLLLYAGLQVELREVLLRDKPSEMLRVSAKGTVPVLVLAGGEVIDESLEVMRWALTQHNPRHWEFPRAGSTEHKLLDINDGPFKHWLDRYKYADRHPEQSQAWYRKQCAGYLDELERALGQRAWLAGPEIGFIDVAVFPFLRQFSMVDANWFASCPRERLRTWLERLLAAPLFSDAKSAPDLLFIKAGTLDDTSWLEPQIQFWAKSKQNWYDLGEAIPAVDASPAG